MKHISEYFEEALEPVLDRAEQAKRALETVVDPLKAEDIPAAAETDGGQA